MKEEYEKDVLMFDAIHNEDAKPIYSLPLLPKQRGRPIGIPGKRKAASELSTNPHTVKARNRQRGIGIPPIYAEWNRRKNADQQAITHRMGQVKKSDQWKIMTEEERHDKAKQIRKEVLQKRYYLSTNYSTKLISEKYK